MQFLLHKCSLLAALVLAVHRFCHKLVGGVGKCCPFAFQGPQRLLNFLVRFFEDGDNLLEHRVMQFVRGANQKLADIGNRHRRIRIIRHRRQHLFAHARFGVLHQFGAELPGNVEKRRRLDLPTRKAKLARSFLRLAR